MTEHQHKWEGSRFVAGLEIRHCTIQDCVATQAKKGPHNEGEWVRIDA